MKTYKDCNDKVLSVGDIIDIHQTVNGQNLFVIANLQPLDIRYDYDRSRKYEYDKNSLLEPDMFDNIYWEIVGTTDDFDSEKTFIGYIIGTHPTAPLLFRKIYLTENDKRFDEEFDNFIEYANYVMSETISIYEEQNYEVLRLTNEEFDTLKTMIKFQ